MLSLSSLTFVGMLGMKGKILSFSSIRSVSLSLKGSKKFVFQEKYLLLEVIVLTRPTLT